MEVGWEVEVEVGSLAQSSGGRIPSVFYIGEKPLHSSKQRTVVL